MTEEEKKKQEQLQAEIELERQRRETRVIAAMVFRPKTMFPLVLGAGLESINFNDPVFRDAFPEILKAGDEESDDAREIRQQCLDRNCDDPKRTFSGLVDSVPEKIDVEDVAFLKFADMFGNYQEHIIRIMQDPSLTVGLRVDALQQEMDSLRTGYRATASLLGELESDDTANFADLYSTPEKLTHVPGIIDDIMNITLECAIHPNRAIALAGALAVLAHLAGRNYTDSRGTYPNLYIILVAPSSFGKQKPRSVNLSIGHALQISNSFHEQPASGQATEDAIIDTPSAIFQIDEISNLLQTMNDSRQSGSNAYYNYLLQIFSASETVHRARTRASSSYNKREQAPVTVNPSLTIFGCATPTLFYEQITEKTILSGLLNRCVIIETRLLPKRNENRKAAVTIPSKLLDKLHTTIELNPDFFDREMPKRRTALDGPGVKERFKELAKQVDALLDKLTRKGDDIGGAIWGRALEQTGKLALLYAISQDPGTPIVTLEGVNWAWELCQTVISRVVAQSQKYMYVDDKEKKLLRVLKFIKEHYNPTGIRRKEVSHGSHVSSVREMDEIEAMLVERGLITVKTGARNAKMYFLNEKA